MLSHRIDNLLLPVPVSGSHIGFSTLRMEPCWMALGQAAGILASLAIDNRTTVRDVDIDALQEKLVEKKATLIYYKDISPDDRDFPMVQYLGLRGYIPEWEASLDKPADYESVKQWTGLCGFEPEWTPGKTTRREILKQIYTFLIND